LFFKRVVGHVLSHNYGYNYNETHKVHLYKNYINKL
jgi:hypothetical protein